MHSSVGHHLDCVDVSPARLGSAECGFHCSLHVGRVIDRYEYQLPFQHDSSEVLLWPLPLGGVLPFDLTCAMGRARDHQQRPVVLAKDAQGRRSKQLEASAPSHDDEICVYVGGVFENRASCRPRRHLHVCIHTRRNSRDEPFQGSPRVLQNVCTELRDLPPGGAPNGVGRFESLDRMHHRKPRGLSRRQSNGTPEDVLRSR